MNLGKISLIFNVVLLIAVAFLFYLNFSKKPAAQVVMPAIPADGIKIAYVNIDTLNEKYEWLQQQKDAMEKRIQNAENSMRAKQESLMREAQAFQEKAQKGEDPPATLQKEYEALQKRQENLAEEEQRLSKQLAEDQRKANAEMWSQLEAKLKALQGEIGYDYILAYAKGGGQVLLANDSLEITNQVLELLNTKEQQ